MGLTLSKVEDYRPVPGRPDQLKLVATNHYIRVRTAEGGPLFIQNGRVYSEGGQEIKELPGWFLAELKNIVPEQLKAVKFSLDEYTAKAGSAEHSDPRKADAATRKQAS
jgi:hypothetical protein